MNPIPPDLISLLNDFFCLFLRDNWPLTKELTLISAPNIEDEANKLKDKEGWIKIGDFLKFAMTTDLFKVEFVDRVFHKTDPEEELKSKASKEAALKKGKVSDL